MPKPMTTPQAELLIKLINEVNADSPAARAAALAGMVGFDTFKAHQAIDLLIAAKKIMPKTAMTPEAVPAAPAYVPPKGKYLVDGKVVEVKVGKAPYLIVNGAYYGAFSNTNNAAYAEALGSADKAKAAAVEFGHKIGKCGVCGTKLTDPKSVAKGIGPWCEKKYA